MNNQFDNVVAEYDKYENDILNLLGNPAVRYEEVMKMLYTLAGVIINVLTTDGQNYIQRRSEAFMGLFETAYDCLRIIRQHQEEYLPELYEQLIALLPKNQEEEAEIDKRHELPF